MKVCDLCALTAGPGIGTASAFGSYFFSRTQQFRLGKKTGLISNAEFARPTMFCLRSILPCLVGIALLSGTDTRAESPTANDAGSGFRFTYPVRDEGSSQVYTAPQPEPPAPAAPPASADPVVPAPPPLDPTPRSAASASQPVDVLADSYGGPGEAFQQVGAYDEAPADIGEGIFERRPFRFSFAVYEGYNSNVNTTSSNQIESLYTQIAAGVSYEFGTSRLQLSAALSAALAFYYNNVDLQNDGLFPTINFTLGANYAATPRLDLSLETYTAFLSQPNFTVAGAPTTYDGDYIISSTTFGVKYLWLPKFATETTYTPVFYYFTDEAQNDIQGRFEQTVGQQFIYLWKPTTSLVAEYDFNTRNFFTAAVDETEDVVVRHFLHEADAARAEDAAFVVEDDVLADVLPLGLFDFVLEEVRPAVAEFDGEFLQAALARFVADRAVERVVDEEEFHHAFAAILDQRGIGARGHAFGDFQGAGNLRLGRPGDLGTSVGSEDGLAVGVHLRSADFEQAHAAIARRAQGGVVAVMGDEAAALHAGLDELGALGELAPLAVDLHIDHGGAVAAVRAHGFGKTAVKINGQHDGNGCAGKGGSVGKCRVKLEECRV